MSDAARAILDLIRNRLTIERFEPGRTLDEQTVRDIVDDAIQAPSSFNMQHWRFVAVRRPEDRERLAGAAYGQRQVADAPLTFILLGDLQAVEHLPAVLERAVESGAMTANQAESWIRQAGEIYADPQLSRDEAIRSCSLAAMNLMLAAEARGLGTGVLIGFDPQRVMRDFDIPERYLPVMLVTLGWPAETDQTRKPRLTVDEVLHFDRFGTETEE